jgi:hypothetical protein
LRIVNKLSLDLQTEYRYFNWDRVTAAVDECVAMWFERKKEYPVQGEEEQDNDIIAAALLYVADDRKG